MKIAEKNRAKLEIALKELSETHEKLKEYTIKKEELTVSKERERISQEIHDTLGHYLTIASVQL
jgi:signal transduction histidine kinase